jgi:hypothetical protein
MVLQLDPRTLGSFFALAERGHPLVRGMILLSSAALTTAGRKRIQSRGEEA